MGRRLRALCLLPLLGSCGDLDVIEVREEATAIVEGAGLVGGLLGELGFDGLLDLDVAASEELQNQGVERHQIDSVHLTALTLSIEAPPEQGFDFVDQVQFFAESEGLPRVRIAYGGPFDPTARTVSLSAEDVELVDYVAAPSMDITAEVQGRQPPEDTTIRAVVDLAVDVNLRGAACGG